MDDVDFRKKEIVTNSKQLSKKQKRCQALNKLGSYGLIFLTVLP